MIKKTIHEINVQNYFTIEDTCIVITMLKLRKFYLRLLPHIVDTIKNEDDIHIWYHQKMTKKYA